MKYVLLVTWFAYGQPPSSYQTVLNSAEACATARLAVMMEAQRMLDEFRVSLDAARQRGTVLAPGAGAPRVSAACTPQG